jgi:hypothetical protein
MPISKNKLTANRRNATHSTGPRTPEGKAKSSTNATKLGLYAKRLIITDDDRPEFEQLERTLRHSLKPHGAIEESLFDRVLLNSWQLRRTEILETEMWFDSGIDRDGNDNPEDRKDPLTREWSAKEAERLIRLRNTFETRYYRALKELRTIQTDRTLARIVDRQITENNSALVSSSEIIKRTQFKFPKFPSLTARTPAKPPNVAANATERTANALCASETKPTANALCASEKKAKRAESAVPDSTATAA